MKYFYHILTPFTRHQNLKPLIDLMSPLGVHWHLVHESADTPDIPSEHAHWITARTCPAPDPGWFAGHWKLNWLLDHMDWDTGARYFMLSDDDFLEPGFLEKMDAHDGDLLICSMKRGENSPAKDDTPPQLTHTLIAAKHNLACGGISGQQIMLSGSAYLKHRFGPGFSGDWDMIAALLQSYTPVFVPEAYVWFNYLEPGRWESAIPTIEREISLRFRKRLEFYAQAMPERGSAGWLAAADYIVRRRTSRLVETGSFWGPLANGGGTILLAQLASDIGGKLDCYELDPGHIAEAKSALAGAGLDRFVHFHEGDSVAQLAARDEQIDFAYLDSFDCGPGPDFGPCQKHQLAELEAVLPLLCADSAVLLDDNLGEMGKTRLAQKRLSGLPQFQLAHEGYQCLWLSRNPKRLAPAEFAVVTGHSPAFARLAARTIYHNKAQYALRHGYQLHTLRHFEEMFYEPDNKYLGFSWARLFRLARLIDSGQYRWLWCVGCDTLVTNFTTTLSSLTELAGPDQHLLICGEAVAPLQSDSFLVRCSPEGRKFLQDILDLREQYRYHPWIDNQAMIDTMSLHAAITRIVPQHRLNSYDYRRFYDRGAIYQLGQDCYGQRGQWQAGDFIIHWPDTDLETRIQLAGEWESKVVY